MPLDPPNSPVFFGREPDLAHLLDRARRPGVTAVCARAQMGKSALLDELASRLARQPDGNLFKAPLVGITESLGETSDLLLRAVSSLYTRWIASATFREQGGVAAAQQNHDLVGRAGEAVGKLFKAFAGKPLQPLAELVSDTFSGLASANRDVKTGALELPRLQTDRARDLLKIVADISGRPLVLIMDQWEKSPSPETESNILDNFIRQIADWPPCHIFLGVRSDKRPLGLLAKLPAMPVGAVEVFPLPDMHLDTPEARRPLLDALHIALPFSAAVPDDQILGLLDGYPGTLARWLATNVPPPVASYAQLAQLADDANHYRYPEFDAELPLLRDWRPLAMRVALLPYAATAEGYRKLRAEVLASARGAGLDELKAAGILDSASPPSFGHAKRADAARAWFLANAHEELYDVAHALILALAARVRQLAGDAGVFAGSLSGLRSIARQLDLSPVVQALAQSAASVMQDRDLDPTSLLDPDLAADLTEPSAILLSFGLFNFFNQSAPGSPLASQLLGQLRAISAGFAQVAPTHIQFATALFNAANNQELSTAERDQLLNELRRLSTAYPALAPVAELLARALFNAFNDTAIANEPRRAGVYAELAALAQSNPGSVGIQDSYSRATHERFLQAAKQGGDPSAAAALLDRLRKLAIAYSSAPSIVLSFAMGLRNAMLFASDGPAPHSASSLLQELGDLSRAHAADPAIAKQFALGLLASLRALHGPEPSAPESLDVKAQRAAGESLLDQVRALHRAFAPDPYLGEALATGLFYTIKSLDGQDAFSLRQPYLAEARALILEYPSTRAIQEKQAQSIVCAVFQASGAPGGTPETRAPLLAELEGLIEINRDSPVIQDLVRSIASKMNPPEPNSQPENSLPR